MLRHLLDVDLGDLVYTVHNMLVLLLFNVFQRVALEDKVFPELQQVVDAWACAVSFSSAY